jgi:amino acid adenylation domain-containing protein
MGHLHAPDAHPPFQEQEARRHRVAPVNPFIEFGKEEIEQSIPDRFEQQVRRYPGKTAVKTRKDELTYATLNQAANRVARAILAERGSGEEPIALILENGAPMIVAILGVLKVGKTYVPLDPSLARARIMYIVEDSSAGLIVTNGQNLSLAEGLAGSRHQVIDIDRLDSALSTEDLGLTISPDTLSWILYTSGSTGHPKGCVQSHRNVLHFVMNYTNALHVCANDRLALLYSCSVNAGAHVIFTGLLNGASLYSFHVKEEGLSGLAEWLTQHQITIYSSVPTLFRHFVSTLTGEERFPKLRLVKMMGEPVYKRDVELFKRFFSADCIFVNRLGSSETGSIRWHFIDKETEITGVNVPVGYAVEDNEVLLIDDNGEEVGLGQVGEIAVKSSYLSPGYWQRPDLTERAFSPDPEGGDKRIYRTGDLGLMHADGCLVCLGRKDFQLKIRGYRVEAAEIEMALLEHDAIKEAVVMVREDLTGDASPEISRRLAAYFVPSGPDVPTVTELRRFLSEAISDYMIPSAFVALDALPLAPNGKVDRSALPPPDRSRPKLDTPFVAPRTPVEEVLVDIWAEVLGRDRVGIYDNFFDLGGHSLLATQIVSRVITALRVKVPLQSLFQSPNVADMALVVAQTQAERASRSDIERMLAEFEAISDLEARRLLAKERARKGADHE